MAKNRVERLNSLLREVISEVVHNEVRDPRLGRLVTVTGVDISKDLQHAKVLISVIGTQIDKDQSLAALEAAAGFIAIAASKKVTMRYFPQLTFKLDTSVDQQIRIDSLLDKIHNEQNSRKPTPHDE